MCSLLIPLQPPFLPSPLSRYPSPVSLTPSTTISQHLHRALACCIPGGSEKVKKSKVEAGGHRVGVDAEFSAGFEMSNNMREAVYINLGLLSLKKVR